MTTRMTPYRQLRYPCSDSVVTAGDIMRLAYDLDAALNSDDDLRTDSFRLPGTYLFNNSAQSLVKNTLTTMTFTNVYDGVNNGANGGYTTSAFWSSTTNPTRITVPIACLVFARGATQLSATAAMGTNGEFEVWINKNGSAGVTDRVISKVQPPPSGSGTINAAVWSIWGLAAGDYLEFKAKWNGTATGPFNANPTHFGVQILAVP